MRHLLLSAALLLLLVAGATGAITSFELLETPIKSFWASMDLNGDGSRLAANFGGEIYLLEDGVWTHLGFGHALSASIGISADGRAITSARDDNEGIRHPAIWYESSGWTDQILLGGIAGYDPCDNSVGSGYSLNHDGSIAIGLGWNDCQGTAFMWTAESGMVDIGEVRATVISDDGRVIAGFDHHPEWGMRRPVLWYKDPSLPPPVGVTGPFLLGGENDGGECFDLNSDGSVIVGYGNPEDSGLMESNAWFYTEDSGVVMLGTLEDNEWHRSMALQISDDGKIAGVSGEPPPWGMFDTFIWTEEDGMLGLKQMILDSGVEVPDGFEADVFLTGIHSMSNDGSTLIGQWQDLNWEGGQFIVTFEGSVAIEDDDDQPGDALPEVVRMDQNFPNPFNPGTSIRFSLPRAEDVRLAVYDVAGRLVRTLVSAHREAGTHTVTWDGLDDQGKAAASGTYLYRLESETRFFTRTMSLRR